MTEETSSTSSPTKENIFDNDINVTEKHLTNGCKLITISSENEPSSTCRRKLILHFDNRNTLQVANSISATTIEQGVNNFLTGVLWGYEDESGVWQWISDKPSVERPNQSSKCITYFKYLENQIVKKAIDRKDLRQITGSFVQYEGSRFKPFYDELIEALRYYKLGSKERHFEELRLAENRQKQENSTNQNLQRRFSVTHLKEVPVNGFRSLDGTMYHYIFPSFFRLIQHLQETKRDFVIYLRTMGGDSSNFLGNARSVVSNQHPSFRFEQNVIVHSFPGTIKRPLENAIVLQIRFEGEDEEKIFLDDISINKRLIQADGIHAVQDDFDAWCNTNYHYSQSKPIWFDPNDLNPKFHHILFDDNFRVLHENDCIVDIRAIDAENNRAASCPFEFYPHLENVFAVQADLWLLLADEEYFIKQVRLCEENYEKLLENRQILSSIKEKTFPNSTKNS